MYLRAQVAVILEKMNWNDVSFVSDLSKDTIRKFVEDFAKCIRKEATAFSTNDFGGITGKKSAGSAAAAFRFDPNKMAIWLVAGLLDVTERLFKVCEKGETPSLVPIRRSLQMIIDNMQSYSGIYQMLSAFRDPSQPRTKSQRHVSMAIDVIGFGYYLKRSNVEMLEMALAAILSGLYDDGRVRRCSSCAWIQWSRESAFGMVLLLHDSRSAWGNLYLYQGWFCNCDEVSPSIRC